MDRKQRREIANHLATIIGRAGGDPGSAGLMKSPFTGKLSGRLSSRILPGFGHDELSIAQRKWQSREISNVCGHILLSISGILLLAVHIS